MSAQIEQVFSRMMHKENLRMWGKLYVGKWGQTAGGWLVDSGKGKGLQLNTILRLSYLLDDRLNRPIVEERRVRRQARDLPRSWPR
jgi:hypothetical protein